MLIIRITAKKALKASQRTPPAKTRALNHPITANPIKKSSLLKIEQNKPTNRINIPQDLIPNLPPLKILLKNRITKKHPVITSLKKQSSINQT